MQNYVLLTLDNNLEAPQVAFLQTHQPIFYQIRNPDIVVGIGFYIVYIRLTIYFHQL